MQENYTVFSTLEYRGLILNPKVIMRGIRFKSGILNISHHPKEEMG